MLAVAELLLKPKQAFRPTFLSTRIAVWPFVLISSARFLIIFYVNAPAAIRKGHR